MSLITSFEEYQRVYKNSIENPEKFWAEQAEEFIWKKKWDKVLDWNFDKPKIEWFVGGKLNITENCLDRHLAERGNQIAYYWEPNELNEKAVELTYKQLHEQVCKFSNVLKKNGAKKGDRICIYMPMVPELAIAVLACARIGAIHSVVFGGFSASALSGRIQDCDCNIVVTSDGAYRGAKAIPMKETVDEALEVCPSVKKVVVLERTNTKVNMLAERDVLWKEEMKNISSECEAEIMDAEDMLFILYTSGSTGKPKGVVHTCGGYMVYTDYTFKNVFQYPSPTLPKGKGGAPKYYTTNPIMFKLLNEHAKRMRDNPTPAENMLWNSLKGHKANYHIRRQHIIGQFIVDFVCIEKKLVIEVDGDIHDYQIEEDAQRTAFLNEEGFEVIRFRNEEVYEDVHFISLKIESILDNRKSYDVDDNHLLSNEDKNSEVKSFENKIKNGNKIIGDDSLPSGEGRGGVYWCTADIGWITGHSYIVYAPLLAGATSVMFEGVPTYPDAGRFWQVIDKYKVDTFYTAPTAIRALEAAGLDFVKPYKLDSLRVLGSVGEPINEEAWNWYNEHIGKGKCPIVDTWWQTETGGILISPLAGITKTKPSFATLPLPGIQPILVDEKGNEIIGNGVEGNLCIKFPWPSIIRTTYGDHERCKQTYFATYPGLYFTGDGCKRDEEGYYRITGRVDDVMNVSGHRIGTAEVESAINMHADVVESAVVGYPHDIKGQGIYAYVICTNKNKDAEVLRKEILAEVTKVIGPIAKPDKIQIVSGLPKTRSGKIMRRILRKVAEGDVSNLGDTSTLLDPAVVEEIKAGAI